MNDNSANKNPFIFRLIGMGKPYFTKTPWWLKQVYPARTWNRERNGKNIYLTFDDGPEPLVTPFVLDELKKYNAKASFFCIGKNVAANPILYQRIIDEGHQPGNHTQNHLNGWKTPDEIYLPDIAEAGKLIKSDLFRPPYGRLRSRQAKKLPAVNGSKMRVIMWDILSGDFDEHCSAETCLKNVISGTEAGSIVVFHDSIKAMDKLKIVLPRVLRHFSEKGYDFRAL